MDDLGKTYEQIGDPLASKFWNEQQFLNAVRGHLNKSVDFLVVDLTGFTPSQINSVRSFIDALPQAMRDKIIRVGF